MKKLDKKDLEIEIDSIMNRVNQIKYQKKSMYRLVLFPLLSLSIVAVIYLSLFGKYFESKSELLLTKISEQEYELGTDEKLLSINIDTLVEDDQGMETDEYAKVSNQVNLAITDVLGKKFLKLSVDEQVENYFYIYETDHTFLLYELEYDFVTFEEEMDLILKLYEEYPPIIETVNYYDDVPDATPYIYDRYTENHQAKTKLNDYQYALYSWYINKADEISYHHQKHEDSNVFIMTIYMNGTVRDIADVKEIMYTYSSTEE